MAEDYGNERFIDAESPSYNNEGQSYDSIILMQIKECVKVLSKDPLNMTQTVSKTGVREKSIALYDEEFNHVDTLKMLMIPFLDEGKNRQAVKAIYDDIKNYITELGKKKIMIPGKGLINVSDMEGLSSEHLISKKISSYRAGKARELFEILVELYHKKKEEIASWSVEES